MEISGTEYNILADSATVIGIIIIIVVYILPLAVGIPMCVKNKSLTQNQKAVWIILFIAVGFLAFIAYLVLYKWNKKGNTPGDGSSN